VAQAGFGQCLVERLLDPAADAADAVDDAFDVEVEVRRELVLDLVEEAIDVITRLLRPGEVSVKSILTSS
jgi:hypothetical protein